MAVAERDTIRIEYDFTNERAQDIIYATDPEVIIEGPAGTGKTLAMMWHVHLCLLKFAGSRALLFRKVGQDLTTGALDTYHKGVRPETVGVKTYGGSKFLPAQYQYPNGSVLIPAGLDKADKVLSAEYDMAVGNELTNGITEHDWQTVKTRLRNGKMPFQQLIGDCNPGHVRHWANVRCSEGKARRIVTRHQDNPAYWDKLAGTWTPVGKRYVQETLGSLTGVQRERLLHGKWASAEGLVYPDFNPDQHVTKMDTTGWRKVCGVDVGGVNPTVIVNASISADDRIHVDQVIYRPNLRSSEAINDAIHDAATAHRADTVFIDPSAAATIGDMRRRGLNVTKADNRIEPGIQRVQSYIQRDALTVDPSCTPLLDEFGEYAYPANSKPGNENPVKDNDHTMDALRYVTMGVSKPVFDLKQFFEVI